MNEAIPATLALAAKLEFFAVTTLRTGRKQVTRRQGRKCSELKPGDILLATHRGIPEGLLRILSVRQDSLAQLELDAAYAREEWLAEGFSDRTALKIHQGWRFLIRKMRFKREEPVWRIQFENIMMFNDGTTNGLETI